MNSNPNPKVYVILDSNFGEQLRHFDCRPIWIVMSPINEPVVRSIWKAHPEPYHTKGITGFNYNEKALPEEALLAELDTIELHHGAFSSDPPYNALEIFGASLSNKLESALSELGFATFEETASGFTALRGSPISMDEIRKKYDL